MMSICVQYEGSVPPEYLSEFLSECETKPEIIYSGSGEFVTDGWNQRGWDSLLNTVQLIAERYNCITTLDCYYEDGDEMYCTSHTCDGDDTFITEKVDYREDEY